VTVFEDRYRRHVRFLIIITVLLAVLALLHIG
jgi:hypothetical protein